MFLGGTSHRFPNPKERLVIMEEWIRIIGPDYFKGLTPDIIYHKKRICSNHFEQNCYSPGTKVLNKFALPSLNISLCKY